ncbi:hypothetical protein BZL30_2703 [Mycobacterium kansasii]|uniref:Uncharacterized protein n=1 Tax=Mycobacterium kansasii TaxID=1768 RepID=A0A1V3XHV6_MYCKA|nr:hypothetical protein BZL30_2703 [Mycobacterium kansasii]
MPASRTIPRDQDLEEGHREQCLLGRPAAGEYGTEDDNQLQPEDTLIDRGVDDILDEGYSRRSVRTHLAPSALPKHWTSCLRRKNRIRRRESMCCWTKTNGNAPTKPSAKPSFRGTARSDGPERAPRRA